MPVGLDGVGKLVLIPFHAKTSTPIPAFEVDVTNRKSHLGTFSIVFPINGRMDDVTVSPRANELAWLLYVQGRTAAGSDDSVEVWLSAVNGKDVRRIGSVPVKRPPSHYEVGEDFPHELRWSPDGGHLAFLYRNELRVLSVK